MKHAYLIMAHNNFNVLEYLLSSLDHPNNDIYLHIDKKVSLFPEENIRKCLQYSSIQIYQELSISWGNRTVIECELFLLEKSIDQGYDYYHLLSGADMPIKPLSEIMSFFESHPGKEYVHFYDGCKVLPQKVERRVRYFHFFHRERYSASNRIMRNIYTIINKGLLGVQSVFRMNRVRKSNIVFKYGSTWFSITHDFARYVLNKKEWINQTFKRTNCGDEIFLQTILFNSPYKDKLYYKGFDNSYESIKRYIIFDEESNLKHPYVWKMKDFNKLIGLDCFFTRKFDEKADLEIVKKIYEYNQRSNLDLREINEEGYQK